MHVVDVESQVDSPPFCCYVEYYEEILSHIYSLTSRRISDSMWQVFNSVYDMFNNDGYDYFTGKLKII